VLMLPMLLGASQPPKLENRISLWYALHGHRYISSSQQFLFSALGKDCGGPPGACFGAFQPPKPENRSCCGTHLMVTGTSLPHCVSQALDSRSRCSVFADEAVDRCASYCRPLGNLLSFALAPPESFQKITWLTQSRRSLIWTALSLDSF
jgi:hypothetical protein